MSNNRFSILKVQATATVDKLILILAGGTALELILYFLIGRNGADLGEVFYKSGCVPVFLIMILLTVAVLGFAFGRKGNGRYTVERLGLTDMEVFTFSWIYDFAAIAVVVALQAFLIFLITILHGDSGSVVIIAIYASSFINAIVPLMALEKILILVTNIAAFSTASSIIRMHELKGRGISGEGVLAVSCALIGAAPILEITGVQAAIAMIAIFGLFTVWHSVRKDLSSRGGE